MLARDSSHKNVPTEMLPCGSCHEIACLQVGSSKKLFALPNTVLCVGDTGLPG